MARGPVPNRSDDLSRERDANRGDRPNLVKGESRPASPYAPDPEWHSIALRFWESLELSGQSGFYEQSDWAFAYSLCDDLSEYKKPHVFSNGDKVVKRSPEMLKALLQGMERLLVTEGDRRRVRIELQDAEPEGESASVTAINDYKKGLGVAK